MDDYLEEHLPLSRHLPDPAPRQPNASGTIPLPPPQLVEEDLLVGQEEKLRNDNGNYYLAKFGIFGLLAMLASGAIVSSEVRSEPKPLFGVSLAISILGIQSPSIWRWYYSSHRYKTGDWRNQLKARFRGTEALMIALERNQLGWWFLKNDWYFVGLLGWLS